MRLFAVILNWNGGDGVSTLQLTVSQGHSTWTDSYAVSAVSYGPQPARFRFIRRDTAGKEVRRHER